MKRTNSEENVQSNPKSQPPPPSPKKTERKVDKDKPFMDRCKYVLENELASVFPVPNTLITFNSNASLSNCFRQLVENNILSAPVWDIEEKKYIGFLDVRDLIPIVVHIYDDNKAEVITDLSELVSVAAGHEKLVHVGTSVKELCKRHAFVSIKSDEKLTTVVHILSDPALRRIAIVDDDGKLVNIISQSSILQILAEKCIIIPEKEELDDSLKNIQIGTSPVISVSKNESVIETFRILEKNKRSGLALVDADGRLVGTTTAKDLGLFLKCPNLAILQIPIFQHLQKIRSQQDNVIAPCISVFPEDKLSRAIGLLVATRVHRIFVVEDEQNFRPVSVISIFDILKYLDGINRKN